MKRIEVAAIAAILCVAFAGHAFGQERERFADECPSMKNATLPDLLQFITGVTPDETNAWCVAFAIHKLGGRHYEPAIPALVKLLDFERPQTTREKTGVTDRMRFPLYRFPAVEALDEIGKRALPAVLDAIESDAISAKARSNAVEVWMESYREDWPKGVALLKQEEMKASDGATKQRLQGALQQALKDCVSQAEAAACRQAAVDGLDK